MTAISRNYLLKYPDGSKKQIGRRERDDLLLSGLARQTGATEFAFTGQMRTMHSLSELGSLKFCSAAEHIRKFLDGSFTVVEPNGRRRKDLLETPEAMAYRLKLYPGQARA